MASARAALAGVPHSLKVSRVSLRLAVPNIEALQQFLGEMPPGAQSRGLKYFREGRVSLVTRLGGEFSARVSGSELYTVSLGFDPDDGWWGECSCPLAFDCKHVFALGKTLLAEDSVARVQDLSERRGPSKKEQASESRENLLEQLIAAHQRGLTPVELGFVTRVQAAYQRARITNTITAWDFSLMGLPLRDKPQTKLRLWEKFPASEGAFWNHIALTAQQRSVRVPEFMEPVTDFSVLREELARAQRTREVERWKQALGQAHPRDAELTAITPRTVDLRVRFEPHAAVLECQMPGQQQFSLLKPLQAQLLQSELAQNSAVLADEAQWLWTSFSSNLMYGYGTRCELAYYSPDTKQTLAALFRIPALHSRLVGPTGQPLELVSEPLNWSVVAPDADDGDYRLRVTQHDGAPLPKVFSILDGRPALYVTAAKVFRGPAARNGVLDPAEENVIPAPAMESRGGVALLHSLGVELPPRLRDRVRIVPLKLKLTAELRPSYPGSNSEICFITAKAESADDPITMNWTGYGWAAADDADPGRRDKRSRDEIILLHDRSTLHDPRSLVAPLEAKWEGYRGEFTIRVTKKFPDAFATWCQALPPEVVIELRGELQSLAAAMVVGSVRLEATEAGIDWFDLRVVVDVNDTTLTQVELKLLLNARGKFVRLGDKGWRRLQFNLSEEEDEQLARLGLTPRELSAEPQRLHALQLADDAAKKFLPEQQVERIRLRASEIKARVTPDVPANIHADLRPYQRDGFHFLAYLAANHFGGILADDMGLGKTLQALTWLAWLRSSSPNSQPSLVVCPKSVTDNWRSEVEHFTTGLRVKVWSASELKGLIHHLADADLHVMNYNQLRLTGESLAPVQWLAVILDEGQYIKNPRSVTAQVARQLRAEHRLVLSGTPIENRLLDLWSLMAFAMPGALGSRAQFAKLFDAKEDPYARRRLSARVRPFLLRRTKSQVAKDLPERIEEDLFCEIEGEQKTLYRAELKRAQQMLLRIQTQKQLAQERFHLLTSLLRLRQICCHPKLVKSDSKAASAKLDALLEQIEPLIDEGHKVLVFSQFVEMLHLIRSEIEARKWPMFYLAGETENRGELVRQFQSTEGAAVFLISLKAGGFGLNLTAASYVVLFDPWWNPAVENQAIDRTHRIGQKRNVIAYRLLIKDSIEEKIRTLQTTKSALVQDVLGEEKFAQSLTLDDLNFLFSEQ